MFKGHKGGGLRTPRTRAEELGTDPSGFNGMNYHVPGGHPISKNNPADLYKEQEPHVGGSSEPINPTSPFKIG